jgi:uncharacterized protein YhbP (UPF0306 family)
MNASPLCALATVAPGGRAHINHMYFAWSDSFEVFWISDPESLHSRYLAKNRSAAITVYDSGQTWGRPDRGIQLFGTGREVEGRQAREAERVYAKRFRSYGGLDDSLRLYRFRPRTVKLFDERALAGGMLVTARVTGKGLAWLRTEVWV